MQFADKTTLGQVRHSIVILLFAASCSLGHLLTLSRLFSVYCAYFEDVSRSCVLFPTGLSLFSLRSGGPNAIIDQNQFNWLGTIFYLFFLAFEYPQNVALQYLPVGKWMR